MIGRMRKNKRVARAACTPEQFHAVLGKTKTWNYHRHVCTKSVATSRAKLFLIDIKCAKFWRFCCRRIRRWSWLIKLFILSLPNIAASGQVAIANQKWSSKVLHYKKGIIKAQFLFANHFFHGMKPMDRQKLKNKRCNRLLNNLSRGRSKEQRSISELLNSCSYSCWVIFIGGIRHWRLVSDIQSVETVQRL